jgi:hypothetical protein
MAGQYYTRVILLHLRNDSEDFLEGNMAGAYLELWNPRKQASLKEEETLSLIIGGGEDTLIISWRSMAL